MTSTHEAKLTELRERVAVIDRDIARLDNEFSDLAARFDTGSQSALKEAAIIEQTISRLRSEKTLSLAAVEKLGEAQQRAQAEAERAGKRRLLIQAKQIADQAAQTNVEIDRMLVGLREAFQRRAAALHALIATGQCEPTIIGKLLSKPVCTRAVCKAGLQTIFAIETTSATSFAPLASANPMLLGIGADLSSVSPPPPRAPVERRQPRNNNGA
jgi:hypothetical protein